MDAHALKSLLQHQLATDASTASHLPYVLDVLTEQHFNTSTHTPKWSARLSSLLHSKEPSARWAGLCLCLRTAELSKDIMIEFSSGWITVAIPLLSKTEPLPTLKAAIRLILHLFTSSVDKPEYQRQVCTPNVTKYSAALLALTTRNEEQSFQVLIMDAMRRLLKTYPTLLKPSYQSISALTLKHLNGGSPTPVHPSLLDSASKLFASLHYTGGKAGSSSLWKTNIEETVRLARTALAEIRTTFPSTDYADRSNTRLGQDSSVSVPLYLDRLRCCVATVVQLLLSSSQRLFHVPIGLLSSLVLSLLSCTVDEQVEGHIDPSVRVLEVSVVPSLWEMGCDLLTVMCTRTKRSMSPRAPQILTSITFQLEQTLSSTQRLRFLDAAHRVLLTTHTVASGASANRLTKAVLPSLLVLVQMKEQPNGAPSANGTKSKKRSRAFEGDELLSRNRGTVFKTHSDEQCALVAIDLLKSLLSEPNLSQPLRSLVSRFILSLLISLPQTLPSSLSSNTGFHVQLSECVQDTALVIGLGSSTSQSRTLGLIVNSTSSQRPLHHEIELLLHPRLPPLLRSVPRTDFIALTRSEESNEEASLRHELGLVLLESDQTQPQPEPVNTNPGPSTSMAIETRETSYVSESIVQQQKSPAPAPPQHQQMEVDNPPSQTFIQAAPSVQREISESPVQTVHTTVRTTSSVVTTLERKAGSSSLPTVQDDDEEMPSIDVDSDSDSD
ncbi:rRNA processing/ribosome biogenesis-domain-containing protein [Pterulicium gracile]|uniref:Pre-rRNA-processing protein RIX1 n=1 Tax=Pterulicium gracile TaxID=1884261 RepID=A0A5C3QEP9_9AGAR|nr:rRNA processing/ribosome biogenesis-domain-containing protein [Pterula gracilis]